MKQNPRRRAASDYRTETEVREQINRIDQKLLNRLERAARRWCYLRVQEPEDLVQEAICRTLGGERRWPIGMEFEMHVRSAMRSIADFGERRDLVLFDSDCLEEALMFDLGLGAPSPLDKLISLEGLAEIREQLKGSRDADDVFALLLSGLDAEEICAALSLTRTRYESCRTAIRRAKRRLQQDLQERTR